MLKIRLRGFDTGARLIYETPKGLALRVEGNTQLLEDARRGSARGDTITAEFTQGNYRCNFQARMTDLEEDRSDAQGSVVLTIALPARVRRTLTLK